jgi:hypothetical protein
MRSRVARERHGGKRPTAFVVWVSAVALASSACGGQASSPEVAPDSPASMAVTQAQSETDVAAATVAWAHRGISAQDLADSTRARWFFGHQSVGGNVLKGVDALYKEHDLGKARQVDLTDGGSLPATGGLVAHAHVGRNGHPLEKLADFDEIMRSGVAAQVDAAVLKFCYADVREGRVDIVGLFDEYRRVMTDLERDFPDVMFVYATVPLKEDTAADNVLRTQLNAMIRTEFAETGRLWDIAAIESTTPEGEPVGGTHDGRPYQALHAGFTRDGGHLYTPGTEAAAAPLLELVAQATS